MTRCGAGGKKRELRNIVRSSRFFLQPCCRSGWSRPTSGAQCSSGDCLLLCSGRLFAPFPRPRQGSGACSLLRSGRFGAGLRRLFASPLSAGPVLLRPFSRGGALSSRPVLLRGPFAIGRPGSSPHLFTGRGAPFPAGTPSRPFCCRPMPFFTPSRGAPFPASRCSFGPAGAPSGPRRYRAAANSLSRAISSGQRSSSGVSRMSGMPSKRASEAM